MQQNRLEGVGMSVKRLVGVGMQTVSVVATNCKHSLTY
jgi:hypothetical protein